MKYMLTTPSNPQAVLEGALRPALDLLPAKMGTPEGIVMVLAMGEQESKYATRQQYGGGPAHGFWQNEKGGGVKGVMTHRASTALAAHLCFVRHVPANITDVYMAMLEDDVLAAGMARLLLWTDAAPLPPLGHVEDAWRAYMRVWRPGKPRPDEWADSYSAALAAFDKAG